MKSILRKYKNTKVFALVYFTVDFLVKSFQDIENSSIRGNRDYKSNPN